MSTACIAMERKYKSMERQITGTKLEIETKKSNQHTFHPTQLP
jgi:hypothetical protein